MPKKDLHPEWYENSEVYCDGQLVYTVSSTKEKLNVDIWSGNHPYYTGSKKLLDTEGRVDRFMRKYGMGSLDNATSEAKPSNEESPKES